MHSFVVPHVVPHVNQDVYFHSFSWFYLNHCLLRCLLPLVIVFQWWYCWRQWETSMLFYRPCSLSCLSEWSLFKMFSRTLTEACPLASSSKVYVDVTDNPEVGAVICPSKFFTCVIIIITIIFFLFILTGAWPQAHCSTLQKVPSCPCCLHVTDMTLHVQQGELFDLLPVSPLLTQAVVLGDRRTFAVYDLTNKETFGNTRSLNLLVRWKSDSGETPFTCSPLTSY